MDGLPENDDGRKESEDTAETLRMALFMIGSKNMPLRRKCSRLTNKMFATLAHLVDGLVLLAWAGDDHTGATLLQRLSDVLDDGLFDGYGVLRRQARGHRELAVAMQRSLTNCRCHDCASYMIQLASLGVPGGLCQASRRRAADRFFTWLDGSSKTKTVDRRKIVTAAYRFALQEGGVTNATKVASRLFGSEYTSAERERRRKNSGGRSLRSGSQTRRGG